MSTLSDDEIRLLIQSGRVKIDPLPDFSVAIQTSAIDLTLGNKFRVPKELGQESPISRSIDPRDSNAVMDVLSELFEDREIDDGDSYLLKPGKFVLAITKEHITLPPFLAARVEGRSTAARLGLSVHQSAPTVHATFAGHLQLELTHAGPIPIQLFPGHRICQLVLETMSLPARGMLESVHQSPREDSSSPLRSP